jgi:site-specific recombinase XerD
MVVELKRHTVQGTSLSSLVKGFVLTQCTEGKRPKTLEFYGGNLERFLRFACREGWPDDASLITEWHIRDFLGYVATETNRWGASEGQGSESSRPRASQSTVHHYFVVLSLFFEWAVREGLVSKTPLANIKVAKGKHKVIQPYTPDEIAKMLAVCDWDYQHNAKFLGSRNRAMVLMFLDSGIRVSEAAGIHLQDIDTTRGWIKVVGKGAKERMVRIGQVAQKALWKYLVHRPDNGRIELWLTEEGRPLQARGIQMVIKRLKERGGITSKGNAHRFRHTFALSFLRADGNPFNLQYLLGHSDLRMVRHYTASLGAQDALHAHQLASPADLLYRGQTRRGVDKFF